MKQKICDIKVGVRFRKDVGNLEGLKQSIQDVGLLHPIVVSEKGELIAGFRRLKALEELGYEEVSANVVNLEDLRRGEIQENLARKDFTVSEMVAIKQFFEEKVKAEAEQRKQDSLPKKGEKGFQCSGNLPPHSTGKSRDVLGRFVGVSGKTLEKAEAIVVAAEENPEEFGNLLEKVDEGKTSISHAFTELKRKEKHAAPPPLPDGVYDVIYADPAWLYDWGLRGSPDSHYNTVSNSEVCSLKVPCGENAVLFLWATNPKLQEALDVMKAWGFTYKTNLVWVKDKIGNGYYFRGQHELLLLGVKGNMPTPTEASRPSSVLHAPRQKHSQKPQQVYDLIEQMYPNRSYLELFARNKREGWTSWGNEL